MSDRAHLDVRRARSRSVIPLLANCLLVERIQQLLLCCDYCLSVPSGDFGRGTGLLDGSLGLCGQKRAITLRLRIPFGDGGRNLCGPRTRCTRWPCRNLRPLRRSLTATAAVRGKAFGYLLPQCFGRRRGGRRGIGKGQFGRGVKQRGAHFAQTQTHFREIV